jgi:RimJ/RimL family protein N-acetyltransferase
MEGRVPDPRILNRRGVISIRLIAIDDRVERIVQESGDAFQQAYGASLGDNEAATRDVVAQTLALLRAAPRAPEWGGYLVVDQARDLVIGTCGYAHGPEADGTVEIAYHTFAAFEGRGYASAMARDLIERAVRSGAVREIVAHTLPERNASTRILEKAGLRRAGEARDPEVGMVWQWACPAGEGSR